VSGPPEATLPLIEFTYQWLEWVIGAAPSPPTATHAPADGGGDGDAPRHAADLKLGVNERYRPGIELAAQRTGIDPAAIAAIINAEAGPVESADKRNQMTEEAFRFLHPERDWDQRPLSAKDPADAALIKEWKALHAEKAWEERSYNPTGAAGLTQFLESTWRSEAQREGTYLHTVALDKGLIDADGHVLKGQDQAFLDLRYDPTLSIVAAAEYDKSVLAVVSQETKSDPSAADRELAARHPDRDFAAQPLDPHAPGDRELIKEWKEIAASGGAPLVPPGLTNDQMAHYLYLCHHEGQTGAEQVLGGTLTDAEAQPRFVANVPKEQQAAALAAHGGSQSAAYQAWLWDYIDDHIEPEEFRQ